MRVDGQRRRGFPQNLAVLTDEIVARRQNRMLRAAARRANLGAATHYAAHLHRHTAPRIARRARRRCPRHDRPAVVVRARRDGGAGARGADAGVAAAAAPDAAAGGAAACARGGAARAGLHRCDRRRFARERVAAALRRRRPAARRARAGRPWRAARADSAADGTIVGGSGCSGAERAARRGARGRRRLGGRPDGGRRDARAAARVGGRAARECAARARRDRVGLLERAAQLDAAGDRRVVPGVRDAAIRSLCVLAAARSALAAAGRLRAARRRCRPPSAPPPPRRRRPASAATTTTTPPAPQLASEVPPATGVFDRARVKLSSPRAASCCAQRMPAAPAAAGGQAAPREASAPRFQLALALALEGQHEPAEALLRQVLELEPTFADAELCPANCLQALGRRRGGRRARAAAAKPELRSWCEREAEGLRAGRVAQVVTNRNFARYGRLSLTRCACTSM